MKLFQFLALLCGFVLSLPSCVTEVLDARDAVVGTYNIYYTGDCYSGSGTVFVKKGNADNELLFTDSGMSNYRVVLKEDNSFDFYYYQPDGFSGLVPVNGYGSFSTNRINYFETVLYDWGSCSATVVGTK